MKKLWSVDQITEIASKYGFKVEEAFSDTDDYVSVSYVPKDLDAHPLNLQIQVTGNEKRDVLPASYTASANTLKTYESCFYHKRIFKGEEKVKMEKVFAEAEKFHYNSLEMLEMKQELEKAFPSLEWEFVCNERPEVQGKKSGLCFTLDDLGNGKMTVDLTLDNRSDIKHSYTGTYVEDDPVKAVYLVTKDLSRKMKEDADFLDYFVQNKVSLT